MDKQEAYMQISEKLQQARTLIKECEGLSEEIGENFNWELISQELKGNTNENDKSSR